MNCWSVDPPAYVSFVLAAILGCVGCVGGCGGSTGPTRYAVSGHVTFNGEPVPEGFIRFVPDTTQGASGPATGAPIENGAYATASGKGTVGGPHVVTITGHDGVPFEGFEGRMEPGRGLFPPYETHLDLPKDSSVQNFDVPSPR